jgi:hypothetical protein
MPKIIPTYRPNGRRRIGRPLKRLSDEAKTGISRPNIMTDDGDDDDDDDDDYVNKKVRCGVGTFKNVCPKTPVLVKTRQ